MTIKQTLLERIRTEGSIRGDIVKVDRFLNHMVDPMLMQQIGKELAGRFKDRDINKILTAESSGIMVAQAIATELKVPFVYAKKQRPITMRQFYAASCYSFTRQEGTALHISHEVITAGDRILFADDFFARGSTLKALTEVVRQARAELVGSAVIINKSSREDIESIVNAADLKTL